MKAMKKNNEKQRKQQKEYIPELREDCLVCMSYAPSLGKEVHAIQYIPLVIFTAFVIGIVRMVVYSRPMSQFYWTSDTDASSMADFFSYGKMVIILLCGISVLLFLFYRLTTQSLVIRKSAVYIPMLVYVVFVILSYIFSEYKEFALFGWNDRFEGTLVLLTYMVMLFYIINSINTEKGIKRIVCATAISSALLGLLGLTQALGYDFFQTKLGKLLILPPNQWDSADTLVFTFQNKEIYQTVYNINYVSFYLTLLLPLFGLLFIRSVMRGKSETLQKKIIWGGMFALLLFNMIGAASAGGFFGMAIVVLLAIVLFNKKILSWRTPLLILIGITVVIGGLTYERWTHEIKSAFGDPASEQDVEQASQARPHIDDFQVFSEEKRIRLSVDGNVVDFILHISDQLGVKVLDGDGNEVEVLGVGQQEEYLLNDNTLENISFSVGKDEEQNHFFVIHAASRDWVFLAERNRVSYINDLGRVTDIRPAQAIGWENNLGFGSGRGYIWSRTLPLIQDTIFIGHGADTYCAYFPQNDYVGKHNAGWESLYLVADKPHNMYMGMAVGTGLISVLAFFGILGIYMVGSIRIFWGRTLKSFVEYAGAGIFLGIIGFAAAGLVNDSTVSVMPMFYGLLGTGIATNMMIKGISKV